MKVYTVQFKFFHNGLFNVYSSFDKAVEAAKDANQGTFIVSEFDVDGSYGSFNVATFFKNLDNEWEKSR